ncbi:hypothetical protein GQ55_2G367200 [Panicum hallii var. hallii]|uniref:Uncharacterized protein n=1 Tax=Panicum hallii var. hallii TaxID=1504633 RepID=A0A2T7EWA3_9POAL|nr:hypothetical protein GQ55_2G367200 [Panicum hallii var. hallii]
MTPPSREPTHPYQQRCQRQIRSNVAAWYTMRRVRRGGRPWLLRVSTAAWRARLEAWRARLEELQRAASVTRGRMAEVRGPPAPGEPHGLVPVRAPASGG